MLKTFTLKNLELFRQLMMQAGISHANAVAVVTLVAVLVATLRKAKKKKL